MTRRDHYVECPKCESCFRVAKDVRAVPAHKCWAAEKEAAATAAANPGGAGDAGAVQFFADEPAASAPAPLSVWWFCDCGPGVDPVPLVRDPGEYSACDGTEWYFGQRCPQPRPRS